MKKHLLTRWGHLLVILTIAGVPCLWAEDEDDDEPQKIELSAAQVQTFLSKQLPESVKLLERVRRDESIEDYRRALKRAAEFVHEYHVIMRDDGQKSADQFLQQHRLEMRIEALTVAWEDLAHKDTKSREEHKKQITILVAELFDHELAGAKQELETLRREVKELENEVDAMSKNRATLIKGLLNEFLEESEGEDEEER